MTDTEQLLRELREAFIGLGENESLNISYWVGRIDAALSINAGTQSTDSPSELGAESPSVSRTVAPAPKAVITHGGNGSAGVIPKADTPTPLTDAARLNYVAWKCGDIPAEPRHPDGWEFARNLECRLAAAIAEQQMDNEVWQLDIDRLRAAERQLSAASAGLPPLPMHKACINCSQYNLLRASHIAQGALVERLKEELTKK